MTTKKRKRIFIVSLIVCIVIYVSFTIYLFSEHNSDNNIRTETKFKYKFRYTIEHNEVIWQINDGENGWSEPITETPDNRNELYEYKESVKEYIDLIIKFVYGGSYFIVIIIALIYLFGKDKNYKNGLEIGIVITIGFFTLFSLIRALIEYPTLIDDIRSLSLSILFS